MSQPRIIAGKAKGRALKVAAASRPVTGRIKQSIFDTLTPVLANAKVLDLFAGSGSFGLEALSRGAASVKFLETDYEAVGLLKQNIQTTGFTEQSEVIVKESHKFLWNTEEKFDLIFCDPPFPIATEFAYHLIASHLTEEGVAVVRVPHKVNYSELNTKDSFEILHEEVFGDSRVFFLKR